MVCEHLLGLCSVDVLIMGLSFFFERRKKKKKIFLDALLLSFCFLGDLTLALWLIILLWIFTAKCRCDLA